MTNESYGFPQGVETAVENPEFKPLGTPTEPHTDLSMLTDRELLEATYRKLDAILTVVADVRDTAHPLLEKLQNNPMIRSLIGGS